MKYLAVLNQNMMILVPRTLQERRRLEEVEATIFEGRDRRHISKSGNKIGNINKIVGERALAADAATSEKFIEIRYPHIQFYSRNCTFREFDIRRPAFEVESWTQHFTVFRDIHMHIGFQETSRLIHDNGH